MRLQLDLDIYSLDSIKKAAYRFLEEAFVEIQLIDTQHVRVELTPKRTESNGDLDRRFQNELLDQDLRATLQAETLPLQNLILAHAFSGLTTLAMTPAEDDFRGDPLEIRDDSRTTRAQE